jgi:hypothetical protein
LPRGARPNVERSGEAHAAKLLLDERSSVLEVVSDHTTSMLSYSDIHVLAEFLEDFA